MRLIQVARCTLDAGRFRVLSRFDAAVTAFSAQRAAWCNQTVLHAATRVVVGHLVSDGMLAVLLSDLPDDKPVTVLGGTAESEPGSIRLTPSPAV